jgi:hypothetical protein
MASHAEASAKRPALKRSAWSALASHYKSASKLHLRQLFADHPERGQILHLRVLAQRIIPELENDPEPTLNLDSSTNYLIRCYPKLKEPQ